MPLDEQQFRFESSVVHLQGGAIFRPLAEANHRWVVSRSAPYNIPATDFDILYLTDENAFVRVIYRHCTLQPFGDRKVWSSENAPVGQSVDDNWAFHFLLKGQFEIPQYLDERFERATQPPSRPEPRPIEFWCRFDLLGYDTQLLQSGVDLLQSAKEIQRAAVAAINSLRKSSVDQQPAELMKRLRSLSAPLFNRYRVDPDVMSQATDSIPPEFVDLLQMPWPDELDNVRVAVMRLRSVLKEPLSAYFATRLSPGHEAYPTADEQRLAHAALIDNLPAIESITIALTRALSELPQTDESLREIDQPNSYEDKNDSHPMIGGQKPKSTQGGDQKEDSKRSGKSDEPPKRSWTQRDLDEAIREYKSQRASRYSDLVDGVKRGLQGAEKDARRLFGRNSIVRALGVKSPAMVSNSPEWQKIADELRLCKPKAKGRPASGQRIGTEIALEEQAMANSEPVLNEVVRGETIELIQNRMPPLEAEATIEKLQRGEITDDQARELVELTADQKRDERGRRVRQDP